MPLAKGSVLWRVKHGKRSPVVVTPDLLVHTVLAACYPERFTEAEEDSLRPEHFFDQDRLCDVAESYVSDELVGVLRAFNIM